MTASGLHVPRFSDTMRLQRASWHTGTSGKHCAQPFIMYKYLAYTEQKMCMYFGQQAYAESMMTVSFCRQRLCKILFHDSGYAHQAYAVSVTLQAVTLQDPMISFGSHISRAYAVSVTLQAMTVQNSCE